MIFILVITTDDKIGDFTSTLEVMVDDIDNGTDITCGIFQNTLHLLIYTASEFSFGFDTRNMFCGITPHSVNTCRFTTSSI